LEKHLLKKFLIFASVFIFSNAKASYFETCTFKGTPVEYDKKEKIYDLKLGTKKMQEGSHGEANCMKFEKKTNKIRLHDDPLLVINKKYEFKYTYYNGMGPKGLVKSEKWTVINYE
jgi:hypothetical protein